MAIGMPVEPTGLLAEVLLEMSAAVAAGVTAVAARVALEALAAL